MQAMWWNRPGDYAGFLSAFSPEMDSPPLLTPLTSAWCFSKANEDIGAPIPAARLRNLFISRQQFVQLIQKE